MLKTGSGPRGVLVAIKVGLYAFAAAGVGFLISFAAGFRNPESPLAMIGGIVVVLAIAVMIATSLIGFVLFISSMWGNVAKIKEGERDVRQVLLSRSSQDVDDRDRVE